MASTTPGNLTPHLAKTLAALSANRQAVKDAAAGIYTPPAPGPDTAPGGRKAQAQVSP